jgi:hypothetical protein
LYTHAALNSASVHASNIHTPKKGEQHTHTHTHTVCMYVCLCVRHKREQHTVTHTVTHTHTHTHTHTCTQHIIIAHPNTRVWMCNICTHTTLPYNHTYTSYNTTAVQLLQSCIHLFARTHMNTHMQQHTHKHTCMCTHAHDRKPDTKLPTMQWAMTLCRSQCPPHTHIM